MSATLISHSPDLKRLQEDGYELEIVAGHLVLHSIPYVNEAGKIKRGKLVSVLDLVGDKTRKPSTHVVMFAGEYPCNKDGQRLRNLEHSNTSQVIGDGVTVNWSFSSKPPNGYADYYEKMTTYVTMISPHAEALDPSKKARTFQVIESSDDDSPFKYIDNATGRVGITAQAKKLELAKVAIIGVGGTGSYILDLVAKTPVKEIHLFDGDWFVQHNAFRAPGAATIEDLRAQLKKVEYFRRLYEPMRDGIIAHPDYVDESNVNALQGFDFVFLATDGRPGKEAVLRKLEEFGVPYIDTGMGIENCDDGLRGVLRITTSTPNMRNHVWDRHRIPLAAGDMQDEYATNIQVAELNALSATFSVMKWKKYLTFYADLQGEHFSTYTIDGNVITNEEHE